MSFIATVVCSSNILGILEDHRHRRAGGITWAEMHICKCYLDFAGAVAHIDDSWSSMQQTTSDLQEEASKVGLFINPNRCKVTTRSDIEVTGLDLELVSDLCYLGSYISYNGGWEKDIQVCI